MNALLRRLLLATLLVPLGAVAALALLNPRPAVTLRLLTWTSPALPMGSWLAIAVGGGGLLSAAATAAALQTPGGLVLRPGTGTGLGRGGRRSPGDSLRPGSWGSQPPANPATRPEPAATAGPQRPPGAPPPTVEVPFRVLRQGSPASSRPGERKDPRPATASSPSPGASAVGDGWGLPPSDDW